MKKRNLFLGLILGILISSAVAFFNLSFLTNHFSFLLGFIAGLVFFSLGVLIFLFYNKKSTISDSQTTNSIYPLVWTLVFVLISIVGLVSSFFIYKKNESFKIQTVFQQKQIEDNAQMIASIRNGNLVYLMSNVFDKIDDEIKDNPKRTLSNETISRVIALSHFLTPYKSIQGDNLSGKKISPERGQLLITLSKMNIDSSSFNQIKSKASFAAADLTNADLERADLNGVDLKYANLCGANLYSSNLNNANLNRANLWGANLNQSNLINVDLQWSNLDWVELNGADLSKSNLNGANLVCAKLRKANLSNVQMEWTDLSNTFLNEANFTNANMLGALMRRANLSKTNFNQAKLILVKLEDANLTQTNLSEVDLRKAGFKEKKWLDKLNEWEVIGAKEIQEKYEVAVDKTGKANYRLLNK